MHKFKVLVIGAGLGGLTLAQSLQRAGIDVHLFERDSGPFDRPQGYRLHLDGDAINAAREVLTAEGRALFDATSFKTEPFTTLLKTDLSVLKRLPTGIEHDPTVWPATDRPAEHFNVDRAVLRQILLSGLSDRIHYGKALDRYETNGDRVIAHFSDGTTATGDILVGADGIRSVVRCQRAPHSMTMDAGITAIYGRVPLNAAQMIAPRETLEDIFTVASDERKVFLGAGAVRFPTPPDDAAKRLAPESAMRPQSDYVVCIVGGRHELFPDAVRGVSAAELHRIAIATLQGWPSQAASLIRSGDPASFFLVEMYTSVPCDLDAPTNVTLLGDAIHAMTPTLGRGANLAMRDGAMLGRALIEVSTSKQSLSSALSRYERAMLAYGFSVVREAAQVGTQRMAQTPLP